MASRKQLPTDPVSLVRYKPNIDRTTEMERHATICNDDIERLTQDFRHEVDLLNEHRQYHEQVLEMESGFKITLDGHLGRISTAKHRIELTAQYITPVHSALYRAGPKKQVFKKADTNEVLADDVIKTAEKNWGSSIVIAEKENGKLRFYNDYRKLSAKTKRDSDPIPRMEGCIDSLVKTTIISISDTNSEYWQIVIEETYRVRTEFTSHHGLIRCLQKPLGLRN